MFRLVTRRPILPTRHVQVEIPALRRLSSGAAAPAHAPANVKAKGGAQQHTNQSGNSSGPRVPFTGAAQQQQQQPNGNPFFAGAKPGAANATLGKGPAPPAGSLQPPFGFPPGSAPRLPGQMRGPQQPPTNQQQQQPQQSPFAGFAASAANGQNAKPGASSFGAGSPFASAAAGKPPAGPSNPLASRQAGTRSTIPPSPFSGLNGVGGFTSPFANTQGAKPGASNPTNAQAGAAGQGSSTSLPGSPFAVPNSFARTSTGAPNPFGGTNPFGTNPFANNPCMTGKTGTNPGGSQRPTLASQLADLAASKPWAPAGASQTGAALSGAPNAAGGKPAGAPWDLQTMLSQLATARRPGAASPQADPAKPTDPTARKTIGAPGTGAGGVGQFQGLFQSIMQRNSAMNDETLQKNRTPGQQPTTQNTASISGAGSSGTTSSPSATGPGILAFPSASDVGSSMFKTLIGSLDPEKQEERRRKRQEKYEQRLQEIRNQERERLEREEENKLNRLIRQENKRRVPVAAVQSILQFCKRSHIPRRAVMEYLYQQDGVKRLPSSLITAAQAEELLTLHGLEANFFDINATAAAMQLVAAAEEDDGRPVRAPVVCIMGHVDHGKTTLLDALRRTNVAEHEAGRITQSIGAFPVTVPEELQDIIPGLTFLDTPGHAVFKNMRSRGSSPTVTDIVVLVVSAADGVQLQTKEAVQLAVESERPIIVAITKCDLDGIDPDKVRKQLFDECGLQTEHMGGSIVSVEVSAVTGQGIPDLLEAIALVAQPLNLKFSERKQIPQSVVDTIKRDYRRCKKENAPFESDLGTVIMGMASVVEAHVGRGQGPLLNVIVRQGEIRVGDVIICGEEIGTIKSMRNSRGDLVKTASAQTSEPVQIMGIDGFEALSEEVLVVPALEIAEIMKELRSLRDSADEMMDQSLDWDKQRNAKMKNRPLRMNRFLSRDGSERRLLLTEDDEDAMDMDAFGDMGEKDGRRKGKHKEKKQRTLDSNREQIEREKKMAEERRLFEEEQARVLRVYVKGDVLGSLETVEQYFADLSKSQHADLVQVKLVKSALGDITESDVMYALRTGAHLFGFNVKVQAKAAQLGKEKGVPIFAADVIFHVFDQIAAAIATRMPQYAYHEVSGVATVDRMIPISLSKLALRRLCAEMSPSPDNLIEFHGEPVVCGSRVIQGEIRRGLRWQIRRNNEVIADNLDCISMRHVKTEMATIPKGKECGILLNNPGLVQPGDQIESYELKWYSIPFDDSYARGFDRSYWTPPKGYEPGKTRIRFPHEINILERQGRVGDTSSGGLLRPELRGEESYKETSGHISKGDFK